MANLDPDSAWEFADAIKQLFPQAQTRRRATVQRVDNDGTIWVQLPGASHTTPIQSTGANVQPGDEVLTELRGNSLHITENQTDPAIGATTATRIARAIVQPVNAEAQAAKGIAAEAQAVAQATGQHFFADDNGAHITDVTQDEWAAAVDDNFSDYDPDTKPYHNQLLNSLGILLRTALNNLVSITRSAIAFYDGAGNAASNIVARFGADGAQVGLTDESHLTLDYHSLQMVDKDGDTYFHVSDLRNENGVATVEETFLPANHYVGERYNCNLTVASVVSLIGADSNDYTARVSGISGKQLQFSPSLPLAVDMTLTYTTESAEAKAFTFGTRTAGNVGAMSTTGGVGNRAEAPYSAAFGSGNRARGEGSLAHGVGSIAYGKSSQASGTSCTTNKNAEGAHAFGVGVNAYTKGGTAIGRYNSGTAAALSVGNGTSDSNRSDAFTVDWNGGIYCANHSTPIGAQVDKTISTAVSVPNNSTKSLGTITLTPGTWLILGHVVFPANATGVRYAAIGTTVAINTTADHMSAVSAIAMPAGVTAMEVQEIVTITANTTYNLNAYHTGGTALGVTGRILATRMV